MSSGTESQTLPVAPLRSGRVRTILLITKGITLAGVFAFTLWAATDLMIRTNATGAAAVVSLLIVAGMLMIFGAVYREVVGWRRPVARLAARLKAVQNGELKIDNLGPLPANLVSLREPLVAIVRRARELEAGIKQIESETKQRVYNRTDALERKLGALQVAASRDALTHCFNRRAMDEQLPKLLENARQRKIDLALLMIDVDYFKKLNDTLGHAAGDDLLRAIGQMIRSGLRESDAPFRYGGDEFAVVMPDADVASAKTLADRLRQLVDGLTKSYRTLDPRPQLSIGIATLAMLGPDATHADLLAAADAKLYEIKRARKVQRVA